MQKLDIQHVGVDFLVDMKYFILLFVGNTGHGNVAPGKGTSATGGSRP